MPQKWQQLTETLKPEAPLWWTLLRLTRRQKLKTGPAHGSTFLAWSFECLGSTCPSNTVTCHKPTCGARAWTTVLSSATQSVRGRLPYRFSLSCHLCALYELLPFPDRSATQTKMLDCPTQPARIQKQVHHKQNYLPTCCLNNAFLYI